MKAPLGYPGMLSRLALLVLLLVLLSWAMFGARSETIVCHREVCHTLG